MFTLAGSFENFHFRVSSYGSCRPVKIRFRQNLRCHSEAAVAYSLLCYHNGFSTRRVWDLYWFHLVQMWRSLIVTVRTKYMHEFDIQRTVHRDIFL